MNNFKLDAHRIELVAEASGIRYVDDSKATNPHAADAALSSFESVVWIVGGLLKGVDITELVRKHAGSLRAAVVIGVDRQPVIAALAQAASSVPVYEIADGEDVMARAVHQAKEVAREGDTVLLAPAAASMDQFKDYADRGNCFRAAVLEEVK